MFIIFSDSVEPWQLLVGGASENEEREKQNRRTGEQKPRLPTTLSLKGD